MVNKNQIFTNLYIYFIYSFYKLLIYSTFFYKKTVKYFVG
nr:MAG TPA: hypothetical protein [Caudoviricetes sp.]